MLLQKLIAIITITAVSTVGFMIQVASAEDEKRKVNPETDKAYEHVIAPILASRCTGCHGAIKAKGKFRLHTKEEIQKSETVVGGKVGESSLIERIMLPDDDEDVMPPEGKDRLSAEQKKIINWWIAEGASFDKKISELNVPGDVGTIIAGLVYSKPKEVVITKAFNLPDLAQPADAGAVGAIGKAGVLIMQLAQDTKYLSANAINVAKSFNDAQVKLLIPVKTHLTWLDVSRSGITDQSASDVGQLSMLTKLHLENTSITDQMLQHVGKLSNLEYLNVYGTKVTDAGLEHLKGLKKLKKLYVWQTGVTEAGANKLKEAIPGLDVNMGWKEPKKEDKPEEPKKE
ncbi:MAG: c-type cytochrome domain-containing protein [Verrucomicrobiales bacterium]|nr:c-type cytochrome domain-containing protein [Verrucomicrobiales bacterium]